MKVLMFGWEFPPMKSGGLGTACYDLCKGLSLVNTPVTFVIPKLPKTMRSEVAKLVGANQFAKLEEVNSPLTPYLSASEYEERIYHLDESMKENYGKNLFQEVDRYTKASALIARKETFDVIHAHDWMTYNAGVKARAFSKKPLVAHIHATEFDRTGGNPNGEIANREYEGLNAADLIIANSNYTKKNVMQQYGITGDKIRVVHWGIDDHPLLQVHKPFKDEKVVLFLGRVTLQKGPDYFVELAKRVSSHVPNVKFVFAGSGDKMGEVIREVSNSGLSDKFVFTGFLNGEDVHKAFRMADLYVMPSVSEPFGLVALESIKNQTPVLISKQSGVSEVLDHAFKVDFWDVDEMTNKVVSFLKYPALAKSLKEGCIQESKKFNLKDPAQKCLDCYKEVLSW